MQITAVSLEMRSVIFSNKGDSAVRVSEEFYRRKLKLLKFRDNHEVERGWYFIPPIESFDYLIKTSLTVTSNNLFKLHFLCRDKLAPQRTELRKSFASSKLLFGRQKVYPVCTRSVLSVESVLTPVHGEFASVHRFAHGHRALSSPRRVIARITYATMNYHQRPEQSPSGTHFEPVPVRRHASETHVITRVSQSAFNSFTR